MDKIYSERDCWKLVESELFDELEHKLRSNPQPKWVSACNNVCQSDISCTLYIRLILDFIGINNIILNSLNYLC